MDTQIILDDHFECGVDYLTVTKRRGKTSGAFLHRIEQIVQKEVKRGNEYHGWSMSGYKGFRAGSAEFGERADGYIARVSSGVADDEWSKLYALADNCSRIDLQTTAKTVLTPPHYLRNEYRRMARWSKQQKNRPTVTLLRCSTDSSTIYSGSRSSEAFGRQYDKGDETGLDHYKGCVRRECEFKGELAMRIASQLHRSRRRRFEIAAGVQRFFVDRAGCSWTLPDGSLEFVVHRKRTDAERRLQWLRESVRGTVAFLLEHGYRAELLNALGLEVAIRAEAKSTKRVA